MPPALSHSQLEEEIFLENDFLRKQVPLARATKKMGKNSEKLVEICRIGEQNSVLQACTEDINQTHSIADVCNTF